MLSAIALALSMFVLNMVMGVVKGLSPLETTASSEAYSRASKDKGAFIVHPTKPRQHQVMNGQRSQDHSS